MLPAPCPQPWARRGWRHPPFGRGTAAKAHLLPGLSLRGGTGWGCVPSLQQARSNRSACVGEKTSIQINVYRQTSPLPCSVSMSDGCSPPPPVRGWPRSVAGTQVLPTRAGLSGCLWAGIAVCPTGAIEAGIPQFLQEFRSLGERDKVDGEHGICCSSRLPQTAQ